MNRGVCENPDCPYSHDEKFLKMTKEWQDYQNTLEDRRQGLSSASFSGESEAGKGAFVVIRAAMPAASAASKSSLKRSGQQGSIRKPLKIRFVSPGRKDILSYPWRDKSSVEFVIIGQGRNPDGSLRRFELSPAPAAAVAKARQVYSWQPPPCLGEDMMSDISADADCARRAWIENKPRAQPSIQFQVERICDSGAATALGSIEAWVKQGLPQQVVNENLTTSSAPANLATGGGAWSASSAWTVSSDVAGDQQAYNLGRSCPLVFSQGQVVLEDKSICMAPRFVLWQTFPVPCRSDYHDCPQGSQAQCRGTSSRLHTLLQ